MKVLMSASECAPLVKVGGIADVIGSLPIALKELSIDIRLAIPFYKNLEDTFELGDNPLPLKKISQFDISYGKEVYKVEVYETILPNSTVPVYLLKNEEFISNGGIYFSPKTMSSPEDELIRFAFFSKSIAEIFGRPNEIFTPEILHCNDWHTGMATQVMQSMPRYSSVSIPKTVFTIHNLAYQGFSKIDVADKLGIDIESNKTLKWDAEDDNLDFLLQGIVGADYITTVSEKYSQEIQTPEFGEGLDEILRTRKDRLVGILNGISYEIFNPATDKFITKQYGLSNWKENKATNKRVLQENLNLEINPNKPMIGVISRLAHQKGLDLVADSIKQVVDMGYQVVLLGTGDPQLEAKFSEANEDQSINKNYKAEITFSEDIARKIYAACDMFLIPSRYEPSGLTQMIAMKYGSVPVVRATGGLYDTVQNKETGFTFEDFTSDDMVKSLQSALIYYSNNKEKWNQMVEKCMRQDFSWAESAKKYVALYHKTLAA